jgi:hypothetical protein
MKRKPRRKEKRSRAKSILRLPDLEKPLMLQVVPPDWRSRNERETPFSPATA